MKQPDKALDDFERAADGAPGQPQPHAGRAVALAALGQTGEADGAFREAVELGVDPARLRARMAGTGGSP
jgi:Flp pilus assembly protein TadD